MSVQLNAPNAGSFGELANFNCIRIDENADCTSLCWERVHNSADHSRLDVARARWIKVESKHVRAEFDARACIIRSCNTADFDLYPVRTIGCSHGAVRRRESGRTGHRPVATTNLQGPPIVGTSDKITKSRFRIGRALGQLYATARVYKDNTTLIDPPSGMTWPTLMPKSEIVSGAA